MNAQHTPTPWIEQEMPIGCNDRITADDGEGTTVCEFPYGLDANAAFIVRACNAHEELIAALRDDVKAMDNVVAYLRKHAHLLPPMTTTGLEVAAEKARAALAKADAA